MESNKYETELLQLESTYEQAMATDISALKSAIAGASEFSVIAAGSGGSFTVASMLCNLHETYTGNVSRSSTPLEVICNPTLAASSPIFIISAEGKNPDIVEALQRARLHSARAVHVITNRKKCLLVDRAQQLRDIHVHTYEVKKKDGYLATNSLLLDATLIARAYSELNKTESDLSSTFSDLRVGKNTIADWVKDADSFATEAVERGALTVSYSPLLKPIADDLESKLSESALMHSQLADLRSYAHGRHLWLASRPDECSILALTEPSIGNLWSHMKAIIPSSIPTLSMELDGARPTDLIAGLVAQMYLVSTFGRISKRDVGGPDVPQFGRDLYYLDINKIIPKPVEVTDSAAQSKYKILGAKWPSHPNRQSMRRAKRRFVEKIQSQSFKAIVFDYDGTLSTSRESDQPPTHEVLQHIEKLVQSGILVGIASGRGGSIQSILSHNLTDSALNGVYLGLYNGGYTRSAAIEPSISNKKSEFLSHVTRIVTRLKTLGVPIQSHKTTHPYQVSIRFRNGQEIDDMWFVIADALRQAGLDPASMVKSKHSIDVLEVGVTKSRLIAHIIEDQNMDPYEILTVGDQGAWPGNDSALLEHKYSLSVDSPSRRLDRGWKLAPYSQRDVDATLWYLDRLKIDNNGSFSVDLMAESTMSEVTNA